MGEPQDVTADRIVRDLLMPYARNDSNATINVNAGGIGVWIAAACCAVMLASGLIAAFWVSREFTRLDRENDARREEAMRMQSYLSAIYVQAPHLKPSSEESNDAE